MKLEEKNRSLGSSTVNHNQSGLQREFAFTYKKIVNSLEAAVAPP